MLITNFIIIILFIIFSLYRTLFLTSLPCKKNLLSVFLSNFVHIDFYHLIANLFVLYSLIRIELEIGFKKFFFLITFLTLFNTILELFYFKLYPTSKCSIGFSGVIFGLLTWELVKNKKLDFTLLAYIIMIVIAPSVNNPQVSLSGHAIGAFSGIISGILYNKICTQ